MHLVVLKVKLYRGGRTNLKPRGRMPHSHTNPLLYVDPPHVGILAIIAEKYYGWSAKLFPTS